MGEDFLTERVVRAWHSFQGRGGDPIPGSAPKVCGRGTWGQGGTAGWTVGLNDLEELFQPIPGF